MTDLQELIGLRKGDRSYEQLSKACGGLPTAKRLQQLATAPIKNFPDPATIRSLSKGLGVTESTVVLASAASLGLEVHTPSMWAALLPAGTELIPDHMRDGILSVVHSAVRMARDEKEVVTDGKPQPRRQEAQQAGSAPKTEDVQDDVPEVLTEEWVRERGWAAHVVQVEEVETSDNMDQRITPPSS
jgi:hypothetical protein